MTWVIGIDEAGYGPTLGPLVIGGTLWKLNQTLSRDSFTDWTDGFAIGGLGRLRLADSKQLYRPASGMRLLEASLCAAFVTIPLPISSFREFFLRVTERTLPVDDPWYTDWNPRQFCEVDEPLLTEISSIATSRWGTGSTELRRVASCVIEPVEFNQLCRSRGNKATVLTEQSLSLVNRLIDTSGSMPNEIQVYCDKHGGRNAYSAPLYHIWPDGRLRVVEESRQLSRYQLEFDSGRKIHWNFTAKGDRHAPTALASMVAKFIRERLMAALNLYWCHRLPALKPTAGYPGDAARYLAAILPIAETLGIELTRLRRDR